MMSKVKTLIATVVFLVASLSFSHAEEFSYPGFSGNINTTLTTGLSLRLERNCVTEAGSKSAGNGSAAFQSALDAGSKGGPTTYTAAHQAAILSSDTPGCARQYTDGYGNTPDLVAGPTRSLLSANGDDGNMNFDGGDIFDSTSRVFTEISGSMDNGTSVNLSFVGSYNPITSFTNPTWAPFTSDALDEIETNIEVLDAYISADIAQIDASLNVGQFVTNWGESTFIPIGMNGLTTNAIDLTKLRVPGSSIREALVPAKQVSLSGYLDGGFSYEAYYQFGETHVELDQAGTFFGNEVASGDRLLFTSAFRNNSQIQSNGCRILLAGSGTGQAGLGCTATTLATAAASTTTSAQYLIEAGLKTFVSSLTDTESNGLSTAANLFVKAAAAGSGAAAASAIGGQAGDVETVGMVGFGSTNAGLAGVIHAYTNWDEYTRKQGRKAGALDAQGGNHIYADGDEQFGLALRTYLDDVGQGVDVGFYFSQYDSKTPYLRFKGQRGVHAGDLIGILTLAATGAAGGGAGSGTFAGGDYFSQAAYVGDIDISGSLVTTPGATNTFNTIGAALTDLAYGEAACGAYQNPTAVNQLYGSSNPATASNFAWSEAQKTQALRYYNYTEINGKLYHDSLKCYNNAQADGSGADFDSAATQAAAAALLGAATTPLNMAEYEFIYPENLNAMGMSASTNINGVVYQGEITFRPDFPLATNGGDQGQQLSDSAGTTQLLSIGVAQSVQQGCRDAWKVDLSSNSNDDAKAAITTLAQLGAIMADDETYPTASVSCGAKAAAVSAYRAGNADLDAEWTDVVTSLKSFNRSSLSRISLADIAAGDYYTTPYLEYDVWTATFGTTSTFTASHPIVQGLQADGAVFLTELGIVHVADLDYARGGVNRGGYRDGVGGAKCGGATAGGSMGATNYGSMAQGRVMDAATHIGSSQTDPLFGNGSYCESKNTIDDTSMTYRLIGAATYNNVSNTAWTFSPSFVWSHDFSGYGPTSIGGFVPGRQSLSLSGNLTKGDMKVGLNYVNQLGDEMDNLNFDRDYLSASVSYAF